MAHKRLVENCTEDCPSIINIARKYDITELSSIIGGYTSNGTQLIVVGDANNIMSVGDTIELINNGVVEITTTVVSINFLGFNSNVDTTYTFLDSNPPSGWNVSPLGGGSLCTEIFEVIEKQCDDTLLCKLMEKDADDNLIDYTLQGELSNSCGEECSKDIVDVFQKYDLVPIGDANYSAYSCNIETVINDGGTGGVADLITESIPSCADCGTPQMLVNVFNTVPYTADLSVEMFPIGLADFGTNQAGMYKITITGIPSGSPHETILNTSWNDPITNNFAVIQFVQASNSSRWKMSLRRGITWVGYEETIATDGKVEIIYIAGTPDSVAGQLCNYDDLDFGSSFGLGVGQVTIPQGDLSNSGVFLWTLGTADVCETNGSFEITNEPSGGSGSGNTTVQGGVTNLAFPFDADSFGGVAFGETVTFTDVPSILTYFDANSVPYNTTNVCTGNGNFTIGGAEVFTDVNSQSLYFAQSTALDFNCVPFKQLVKEDCEGIITYSNVIENASNGFDEYTVIGTISDICPGPNEEIDETLSSCIKGGATLEEEDTSIACSFNVSPPAGPPTKGGTKGRKAALRMIKEQIKSEAPEREAPEREAPEREAPKRK